MSSNQLKAAATGKTNAPSTTKEWSGYLDKLKPQLALALPKHMNPDRMTRLALTCLSTNSKLQECTPTSIAATIVSAAQLGLEIGVNGQAYMIPYGKTATFVPGWKGLVDLVARSGRATVWTGAVYEGDDFDYQLGDTPYCRHRPQGEDSVDKLTHVYAIGRVKGSEQAVIEVWPMKKVQKHLTKMNKIGRSHYAFSHMEMYARKVALLQVLKYMPMSIELSAAVSAAETAEDGKSVTIDQDFVVVDQETGEVMASDDSATEKAQTTTDESATTSIKASTNEPPMDDDFLREMDEAAARGV